MSPAATPDGPTDISQIFFLPYRLYVIDTSFLHVFGPNFTTLMSTPVTYVAEESNLRRQELLDDAFTPRPVPFSMICSSQTGPRSLDADCGIGRTTQHLREQLP